MNLAQMTQALTDAEHDVKGDMGEEAWEQGGWYEIVQTIAMDANTQDLGEEFCRRHGVTYRPSPRWKQNAWDLLTEKQKERVRKQRERRVDYMGDGTSW